MYFVLLPGLDPLLLQRENVSFIQPWYMKISPIMKSHLEKWQIIFEIRHLQQQKLKQRESTVCLRVVNRSWAVDHRSMLQKTFMVIESNC